MQTSTVLLLTCFCISQAFAFGQAAGGVSEQSAEEGKSYAKKAHGHAESNGLLGAANCDFAVSTVTKFSTQVVSGVLYRVSYNIEGAGGCDDQVCDATIWSQPWMDFEEIKVKCHEIKE